MAGKTVSIALEVNDPTASITRRTKEARALNAELEKARGTSVSAKMGTMKENEEYNRGRGAMGATGAGARDFANQAQGLGGVVRLYATWAANIFAVSAAFNALSQAANTTNMIEGMNQLSAATGLAMGSMAKRFAEASGGAISLREAMEATTKAVSSGLSQEQFDKLGQVATKASRALGVGMSDAVSRLTRGITKLEPELLDELGIFTKVGTAVDAYAKSVGKSATSLTDFERRQAFANAVLDEGLAKFGEINVDANPYDQLAASLRNLTQDGLSFLNKFLGPLIGALSTSPTALAIAVAGLGTMLLKQAIPAVGQYRESLARSLEESRDIFAQKERIAKEASANAVRNALSGIDNMAQVAADKAAERLDILQTIVAKNQGKFGKTVKGILAVEDLTDISEDQIRRIEAFSKSNKGLSRVYSELAISIREAKIAKDEYIVKEKEALALQSKRDSSRLSDVSKANREAAAARAAFTSRSIVSQASADVGTEGISGALQNLRKSIKETPDMGPIRKGFTGIAGAASIATTAVTRLIGSISGLFGWIGAAVAIFATLDGIFSSNSSQVTKFGQSVEYASEAFKTAVGVTERFMGVMSVEAITARANAIDGISTSMGTLVTDLEAADKAAGFWDRNIVDSVKDLFGAGLQDKFRDSMSDSITAGLKVIDDPKTKAIAEEKLKSLLNVSNLDLESIQDALDDMDPKKVIAAGKAIQIVFKGATTQALAAKAALQSVDEAFKGTESALQALENTLKNNDPIVQYGNALIKQGLTLAEAFKSPEVALASMRDIMLDVSKIKLFPPDVANSLLAARDQYAALDGQIKSAETHQRELNAKMAELRNKPTLELYSNYLERTGKLREVSTEASQNSNLISELKSQQTNLLKELGNITSSSIDKGFDLVLKQSGLAAASAALNSTKSLIDSLPQTASTARRSAELESERIGIQIAEIRLTEQLLNEARIGNELQKQALLSNKIDTARSDPNMDPRDYAARVRAPEAELKQSEAIVKALSSPGGISKALKSNSLEKTEDTIALMNKELGALAKIAQLSAQQLDAKRQGELKAIALEKEAEKKRLQTTLDASNKDFADKAPVREKMGVAERAAAEEDFRNRTEALRLYIETAGERIAVAQAEFISKLLPNELAAKDSLAQARLDLADKETKFKGTEDSASIAAQNKTANELAAIAADKEIAALGRRISLEGENSSQMTTKLDLLKQEQDLLLATGAITSEQYRNNSIALTQQLLDEEKRAKLAETKLNSDKRIQELEKQKLSQNADAAAATQAQIDLEVELNEIRTRGIEFYYNKKQQLLDLENSMTDRTKAYGEIFIGTIDAMADAMVEFVKTGKLDFSSLVDSMLADLLRYELRLQYMQVYESMGGASGILGSIVGAFTGSFGSAGATVGTPASAPGIAAGPYFAAKGASFNGTSADFATQKFAKGGTFTNSIVNSPTLFKFAKGTGLMGEAGPEAIMPLKRDSNGNLGVRANAQQPNVSVTVVNNSNAQAETKETTDSRGNRNIEVVIGEMVSGELSRTNSSMQNSMKNTFGTTPMLTRR